MNVKKFISSVFNDIASEYDSNRFFGISARHMIDLIHIDGSSQMLDVASGTGSISVLAAEMFPQLEIHSVDLSENMLNQARCKASDKKLKNIQFIQCDIDTASLQNEVYDIITCGYALFFFPDIDYTFRKIYKSLKTGGYFIFSTFTRDAFSPFKQLFIQLLNDFDVHIPMISRSRLETEQEIADFCQVRSIEDYHIKKVEIRYPITLKDWWILLESAGYKGLLDQVGAERMGDFKRKHQKQIAEYLKDDAPVLVADSYFTIIRK